MRIALAYLLFLLAAVLLACRASGAFSSIPEYGLDQIIPFLGVAFLAMGMVLVARRKPSG